MVNPPPNFSQTRGRGRAEKESGGVWGGAAPPPPPQFAVSIRGSEKIHMRAVLLAGCHFEANVHDGLNKLAGGLTKQRKTLTGSLCEGLSMVF